MITVKMVNQGIGFSSGLAFRTYAFSYNLLQASKSNNLMDLLNLSWLILCFFEGYLMGFSNIQDL